MNEYVHHILIYLCNAGLSVNDVNDSGNCFVGDVGQSLDDCAQSELIGGWAVGGSVSVGSKAWPWNTVTQLCIYMYMYI